MLGEGAILIEKFHIFLNFRFWRHASEQNTFFSGPPFGPLFLFLESMESQLSLEKNIVAIADRNLVRFEISLP